MAAVKTPAKRARRSPRPGASGSPEAATKRAAARPGSPAAPAAAAAAERPPADSRAKGRSRVFATVAEERAALAEVEALAFAMDSASEGALREGLAEFRDAQVWPGNLHTAQTVLGEGHAARLLIVDVDEVRYPSGAIHELAAVCEVGTMVIALGSDATARFTREVMLAGVSDYLVKPIRPAAVRDAALRAVAAATDAPLAGWLVGFAGTGGSGATTLAAATALLAAERGRYVSVLDLNRSFCALGCQLDVEPAGGLVDLLSTAARASLNPDMVTGMRAERSHRITVYGYPWTPLPPPLPPVWAVCELLVELQRRSHLVIVDGMDDPGLRQALLAIVDARILIVEPTLTGARAAADLMAGLGPMVGEDWPLVLVQNHTRALKAERGARTLRRAGVPAAPHIVIPFDPLLPSIVDRGWPQGRLPGALRKPLNRLADRILAPVEAAAAGGAEEAVEEPEGRPRSRRAGSRARPPRRRGAKASSRSSPPRSGLRRLLPGRTSPSGTA